MKFLVLMFLLGCNQWIRPNPGQHHVRNVWEQKATRVLVEMTCDPFAVDPFTGDESDLPLPSDSPPGYPGSRWGYGVMVSDWQVLTALHVVDCQSDIPTIHVETDSGKRYRFAPEKEWRDVDIARIQMASADSFSPSFPSPAVRYDRVGDDELLTIAGVALGESAGGPYYHAPVGPGWSGSGVYDFSGYLVGVHLASSEGFQYYGQLEEGMVP